MYVEYNSPKIIVLLHIHFLRFGKFAPSEISVKHLQSNLYLHQSEYEIGVRRWKKWLAVITNVCHVCFFRDELHRIKHAYDAL